MKRNKTPEARQSACLVRPSNVNLYNHVLNGKKLTVKLIAFSYYAKHICIVSFQFTIENGTHVELE
jgi:hypothetical protein